MGKKRKVPFSTGVRKEMKRLDALKYQKDADFDAIETANRSLAIAAGLRKPKRKQKSLAARKVEAEIAAIKRGAEDAAANAGAATKKRAKKKAGKKAAKKKARKE
jgi:hypothetical protein